MRILAEFAHCGPSFVSEGWRKVFEYTGHEFKYHMPGEAIFDAFRFEPDIYIGRTFSINRAITKNILSRPKMKVGLYAGLWGSAANPKEFEGTPVCIANDDEKRAVEAISKQVNFVFIHHTEKWIEPTLGGWKELGIKPISLLNAADTFDYGPGTKRVELECDCAFVGGYWGYKAINLNKYILPVLNKFRWKIFGNQVWPVPQYLGSVKTELVKDIFASAKICPNISEPHSYMWSDIVERPFKVLYGNNFCITDRAVDIDGTFRKGLVVADDPQDFANKIEFYLKNPEKTLPFINEGGKIVRAEHTYFHRVAKMFNEFGLNKEAINVMTKYEDLNE